MRDKPCEPVVLMLLGLLGYPGIFRQLARLKKNFWMYMDGPVYALRMEYQGGMQRLLRGI